MNLVKRLHNLWKLSELEVPELGEKPVDSPAGTGTGTGTGIVPWLKKKKMASIVLEPSFLENLQI